MNGRTGRGMFVGYAAVLQLALFCVPLSAATIDDPFTVRTPDWADDQQNDIPITVVHRDSGTVVMDGPPVASLDLEPGRYLVRVAHVYDRDTKRLRYTGFFRLTPTDIAEGRFSHVIDLLGERLLAGRWLDDAAFEKQQALMLAKEEQLRLTRQQASQLAGEVTRTLQNTGVDAAFASASRLHREFRDHEVAQRALADFNAQVCRQSMSQLTSTRHLDDARALLGKRQGEADCARDVESVLGQVADIVSLEDGAAGEVQRGQYVQAYALFGKIKRDYGHLVDPASIDNNLNELLRPLSGEANYKPRLVRLGLNL